MSVSPAGTSATLLCLLESSVVSHKARALRGCSNGGPCVVQSLRNSATQSPPNHSIHALKKSHHARCGMPTPAPKRNVFAGTLARSPASLALSPTQACPRSDDRASSQPRRERFGNFNFPQTFLAFGRPLRDGERAARQAVILIGWARP